MSATVELYRDLVRKADEANDQKDWDKAIEHRAAAAKVLSRMTKADRAEAIRENR